MLADLQQRAVAGELSRDEVARAMAALLDPSVGDESRPPSCARGRSAARPRPNWPPARRRCYRARPIPACAERWNSKPLLDCCARAAAAQPAQHFHRRGLHSRRDGHPRGQTRQSRLTKKSGSATCSRRSASASTCRRKNSPRAWRKWARRSFSRLLITLASRPSGRCGANLAPRASAPSLTSRPVAQSRAARCAVGGSF